MIIKTWIAAVAALSLGIVAGTAQASTIDIANGAEPGTLDPQLTNGTWETRITRAMFERLVTYGQDGSLQPGLASDWEVSDDGKTYTFHLRDANWSDGEPVTAADAVFAFQRLLMPATANHNATLYYPIVNAPAINRGEADVDTLGVKALDSRTVRIRLSEPTAYFPQALAMTEAAPLPSHAMTLDERDWVEPGHAIVSGAYNLTSWMPQSKIVLHRNPAFYAADEVTVDEVVMHPIDDTHAAFNRFRTGEIDIAYSGVPSVRYEWIKENLPGVLRDGPFIAEYFYVLNMNDGQPLADRRVREALNLAVRRDVITKQILGMGQISSYWYVPRVIHQAPGGEMGFADEPMDKRMARAKQLMQEAGYGPGNPLHLQLKYNTLDDHKKIAVAIAAMWRPLGIEVELVNSEAAVHYASIRQGDFEVARYGFVATIDDPYDFLKVYTREGEFHRTTGYDNREYDALVEQSTKELDPAKRVELMTRAQQILLDDYALIPIYDYVNNHLVSPKITGWESNPLDVHPLRYLRVTESR